jgi:parvulin-like peptidyl-prolyl isomerase
LTTAGVPRRKRHLKRLRKEKPQRIITQRQLSRRQQQERRRRIIQGIGIFIIVSVLTIIGVGYFLGRYQPLRQTALTVNGTEFNMNYFVEMLKVQGGDQPTNYSIAMADGVARGIAQNELIRLGAQQLDISVSDDEAKEELEKAELPDTDVYNDLARTRLLTIKMMDDYFDEQVPLFTVQRQVMAMLVESEAQADEVQSRLESGDNFTELTAEVSLDFASLQYGGDFGWLPQEFWNELVGEEVAGEIFRAEVGAITAIQDEEVNKSIGYWLLRVLDIDEEEEEAHVQLMLLSSEAEAQEVKRLVEAGGEWGSLAMEFSQLDGIEENQGEYKYPPGVLVEAVDEVVWDTDTELNVVNEPIGDNGSSTQGGYWLVSVLAQDDNRRVDDEERDLLKANKFSDWVTSLLDDPANEVDTSYLNVETKTWALEQAMRG